MPIAVRLHVAAILLVSIPVTDAQAQTTRDIAFTSHVALVIVTITLQSLGLAPAMKAG